MTKSSSNELLIEYSIVRRKNQSKAHPNHIIFPIQNASVCRHDKLLTNGIANQNSMTIRHYQDDIK